jgi:hypothetical protein
MAVNFFNTNEEKTVPKRNEKEKLDYEYKICKPVSKTTLTVQFINSTPQHRRFLMNFSFCSYFIYSRNKKNRKQLHYITLHGKEI